MRILHPFNLLMRNRFGIIEDCRLAQYFLFNTMTIDVDLTELINEIEIVTELSRKAIFETAYKAFNQTEWAGGNDYYLDRHHKPQSVQMS